MVPTFGFAQILWRLCSSRFQHLPVIPLISPPPPPPLATVLRGTRGSQPLLLEVRPSRFHSVPGWRWEKLFKPLLPGGAAGGMGSGNPKRVESLVRGCQSDGSVFI